MAGTFWTNTIWYLALFATSVLADAIVYAKAENKRFNAAFHLAVLGLILIIEQVILVFLNAYDYYPKIYWEQHIENIFGNMASQIAISCTAMLIVVLDLSWVGCILFAIAFFMIETLFVSLGIYRQYWYKTWFTPIALVPLFWLAKQWFRKLSARETGSLRNITVYLGAAAAFGLLASFPLLLTGMQLLSGGIFPETIHDHKATNFFYILTLAAIVQVLYKWKARRLCKAVAFLMLLAVMYALHLLGVYNVRQGWFFVVAPANLLICYGFVMMMDRLLKHRLSA